MYLFGNYKGSKSSLIIDAKTKEEEIEKFLVDNPELNHRITDLERVKSQYKSMGLDMPKPKAKVEAKPTPKPKARKHGAKKKQQTR